MLDAFAESRATRELRSPMQVPTNDLEEEEENDPDAPISFSCQAIV
jgi:hypothetical protein